MAGWFLWCVAWAWAGDLPLWTQDTFPADADVAGTSGWANGYGADRWRGSDDGNRLLPRTDDAPGIWDDRDFGLGGSMDNWLVRGPAFVDGGVEVLVGNDDDDAVGVVLSQSGANKLYLAFHTEGSTPPGTGGSWDPVIVLLRIDGGQGGELGRATVSGLGGSAKALRMVRTGGRVVVTFDGNVVIDATDGAPLPAGVAGVWAFDSGVDWQGSAFFDTVSAFRSDRDSDGVADDDDNCVDAANPGQVDLDNDGIGDICDPTPPVIDTDVPVDTDVPADTDVGLDTDVPSDTDGDSDGPSRPDTDGVPDSDVVVDTDPTGFQTPDEEVRVACGCATGTSGGAAGVSILWLLGVLRRRHSSRV